MPMDKSRSTDSKSGHHEIGGGSREPAAGSGMNSAETSGVSGKGFGKAAAGFSRHRLTLTDPALPALIILVAAVVAALCFIAWDIARTKADIEDRARLIANLAATRIAIDPLEDLSPGALAVGLALDDSIGLAVHDRDGAVMFSHLPAATAPLHSYIEGSAPLDGYGEVRIALPGLSLLDDVALRHGWMLALLLAGLFLSLRPRQQRPARTSGELLAPAIDAVPYGIAHWHEDGALVSANPAFAQLLRLDPACTAPGTSYASITHAISGRISVRPVLDGDRQRMVEVERGDGSVVLLDERPCPTGGFITIVTDITDRRAADRMLGAIREEQRLLARRYHEEKIRAEASSRAKTSFLAHLSHDIRTPLNHIIGFADLIRLETFGPLGDAKYKSYVADIKRAGEKLLDSFGSLLEFAELEGGRKELKCEPIALDDLLCGCAARFDARAAQAGIRLNVSTDAQGWLSADRHYLDRMLANLVDNALRFTPRGGQVRVAAWPAGDGVVLEITDTGKGMSEELMSKLSQPFVLSDATFARPHEGVGLGIAVARAIAEQSGGRLAIDSLEGVGTTVAISLPLATPSAGEHPHTIVSARAA